MKKIFSVIIVISLCANSLFAQSAVQDKKPKFDLTIDNIMRGPGLVGNAPANVYWSPDGKKIYFQWKRANDPLLKDPDLYVVNADGSDLKKLSEEEAKLAPPSSGNSSKDKKFRVYSDDGDIFIFDNIAGTRRQITSTTEPETAPRFSADQKHIIYSRSSNLYKLSMENGTIAQLTDVRMGPPPPSDSPDKKDEHKDYLKKEERTLLQVVKERAEDREEREAKRKRLEKRKPFYAPMGQTTGSLSLSPSEDFVIASLSPAPPAGAAAQGQVRGPFGGGSGKSTIVPNYITESSYTEDIPARTKVGDSQSANKFAIINLATGESKNIEPALPAKNEAPQGMQSTQGGTNRSKTSQPEVQMFNHIWSEDGKNVVYFVRSLDNKDRWIMHLDPATGKSKILEHAHDDAWIGGPGSFTLGWLNDNKTIYFQSERDGWAHLYTCSAEGGAAKQLTSGKFEVSSIRLSEDKSKFYFTSTEESWFEQHLYSMPIEGGARTRITSLPGQNNASISPDESGLAIVRSYANKPPELYIQPNKPGSDAKQITTSPAPEFFNYNWIDPPIVKFKARDGAEVPARIYKPANYKKGGPAVLFVHGAGYLQNVHKWWSNYYREYMFHHLLMANGYLVLDIDYRASAGYGRDWRTGIYRHMGGKDLTDHVDAAKYLIAEHGVDSKKVGLYGGSYGGFITLMAMFTEPEVFKAGAALRPVTDWAHYNHGYTANILNTPQTDPESYKKSSPIYFAEGLKGSLLICHGIVDVNVHAQDSIRLAQRLMELRKENWELALYPVEDHAFVQSTSWADEYKRIFKLFQTNLK